MKLGLVLDGGGGKGAYQIGVWKAMHEFGLDKQVTAVAGTSVGGLNAALFAQGDFELAYKIWTEDLSTIHVMSIQRDLEALIDRFMDFQKIRNSSIDCFLSAHTAGQQGQYYELALGGSAVEKYVNGEMTYYNLRCLTEKNCSILLRTCSTSKAVMLATSALPVLCRRVFINGKGHQDGGVPWGGDNSPVYPLSWQESDCDTILVIHLNHFTATEKKQFSGVRILEAVPNVPSDLLGFFNGTLNFDPKHAQRLIDAGYRDGYVVFQQLMQIQTIVEQEKQAVIDKVWIDAARKSLPSELRLAYKNILGCDYDTKE